MDGDLESARDIRVSSNNKMSIDNTPYMNSFRPFHNNITNINSPLAGPLQAPPSPLSYSIHSWSSHSATYHPKNILVNKPNDQSSRWSSGSNNQCQFIMVKLDKLSIVRILFYFIIEFIH